MKTNKILPIAILVVVSIFLLRILATYTTVFNYDFNYSNSECSTATRLQLSEDAYQHVVNKRKSIYKNINLDTVGGFTSSFVMWDLFYPSFSCPYEILRVGRNMDGGKYICGLSQIRKAKKCVVYSFGISDDSSFEHEIHENTNCEIFAYDFSIAKPPADTRNDARFHFAKIKVGDVDSVEGGIVTKTLQTIMKENGHDFIDILKMDAEGAEWSVFPKILDKSKFPEGFPVGQIQMEVHSNDQISARTADNFFRVFEEIGFRPFKNELNYYYAHFSGKIYGMEYALLNVAVPHAATGFQVVKKSETSSWK